MPRYFLQLSYNGAQFHGWQKQNNAISVQESLEKALSILCKENIEITGAGRTDTGVHAKEMMAHFDVDEAIGDLDRLTYQLDNMIGKEIAIQAIDPVNDESHARFDAISRTYHYHLLKHKDPFLKDLAYHHFKQLDFYLMNEACQYLLGQQDFSSFSKSKTQTKTNLCTIEKAEWKEVDEQWIFEIKADRFLRNMVRAIVGTLIEIGEGRRSPIEMKEVIKRKDRSAAGVSAPAHALYLVKIEYPESIYL